MHEHERPPTTKLRIERGERKKEVHEHERLATTKFKEEKGGIDCHF